MVTAGTSLVTINDDGLNRVYVFFHFNSNFAFKRAKYVTLTFNYVALRCAAQNSQAGLADILK